MSVTSTTGTASLGVIRQPAGGPFAMNIAVPNFSAFNLTGKFVSISFKKKCSGPSPILFETNSESESGYVEVYNGGLASQSIVILISPDAVSIHDENAVFSRRVSIEGLTVEFSIDVRTTEESDLSWRVQGDIIWQNRHGEFTE